MDNFLFHISSKLSATTVFQSPFLEIIRADSITLPQSCVVKIKYTKMVRILDTTVNMGPMNNLDLGRARQKKECAFSY